MAKVSTRTPAEKARRIGIARKAVLRLPEVLDMILSQTTWQTFYNIAADRMTYEDEQNVGDDFDTIAGSTDYLEYELYANYSEDLIQAEVFLEYNASESDSIRSRVVTDWINLAGLELFKHLRNHGSLSPLEALRLWLYFCSENVWCELLGLDVFATAANKYLETHEVYFRMPRTGLGVLETPV
ncbi:hypothetical protein LTR65_005802 [Meristemomyces frigidus]